MIKVAAGFPTIVSVMLQYGTVPVFWIAVMIAHTLENPFYLVYVKKYCDKRKLWLVEDDCK